MSDAKSSRRAGSTVDIFALAIKERDGRGKEKVADEERSILIAGSKEGGKSSIILRFLDRLQDVPKPTMALEYTFARKPHTNNVGKDIVHLWELGGGTFLTKMVDSVINASTLRQMSCVIVVDLSKPRELWHTLFSVLDDIKARIERILSDLLAKDSSLPQYLRKKAIARIGEDHPDKDVLDPLPVPLVILGTKYDLFQDIAPEHRKLICKTLRFVAHMNGASLHFTSDKDEPLVKNCKALMNHLAFKSGTIRSNCLDHDKPLLVAAGHDFLEKVGAPTMAADVGKVSARNPLDLWRAAYEQFFPPDMEARQRDLTDPAADATYAEAAVDDMRAQKNDVLERYRKQAERRARQLAEKHKPSGSRSRSRKAAPPKVAKPPTGGRPTVG